MLLHKNEDLEIVLGALLTFDKLAFPAVSSSKMTLMEAFSSFWCYVANEWEQRLVF